jgi:hypothetical protein
MSVRNENYLLLRKPIVWLSLFEQNKWSNKKIPIHAFAPPDGGMRKNLGKEKSNSYSLHKTLEEHQICVHSWSHKPISHKKEIKHGKGKRRERKKKEKNFRQKCSKEKIKDFQKDDYFERKRMIFKKEKKKKKIEIKRTKGRG